jgi:hypothetical protein
MHALLDAFETGAIAPADFTHRAHVEAAIALLARTDFLDAAQRYQRGIAGLATRAGAPHKANLTITLAFLSLIAERMATPHDDSHDLITANPDLLDPRVLQRWYSPERLFSEHARSAFLLPDRTVS